MFHSILPTLHYLVACDRSPRTHSLACVVSTVEWISEQLFLILHYESFYVCWSTLKTSASSSKNLIEPIKAAQRFPTEAQRWKSGQAKISCLNICNWLKFSRRRVTQKAPFPTVESNPFLRKTTPTCIFKYKSTEFLQSRMQLFALYNPQ